jgi:hypothetical protein
MKFSAILSTAQKDNIKMLSSYSRVPFALLLFIQFIKNSLTTTCNMTRVSQTSRSASTRWVCHLFLDPMGTVTCILHHADNLSMQYITNLSGSGTSIQPNCSSIRDYHMTNMLQFACKLTYPNPSYYLQ